MTTTVAPPLQLHRVKYDVDRHGLMQDKQTLAPLKFTVKPVDLRRQSVLRKRRTGGRNDVPNLPGDKQSGLAAAPAGRPPSTHINLCWVCPVTCASGPEADQWELRLGRSPLTMPLLSSDQRGFNRSEVALDSSTLRQRMPERQPAAPFVSFPWIFISSCTSFYLTNTAGSCTKSLHQQTWEGGDKKNN